MTPTTHLKLPEQETRDRIRTHTGEVVLRIFDPPEDCGFWLAPFHAVGLERWWQEQEHLPFYWEPTPEIIELEGKVFGTNPKKYAVFRPPGVFLYDGTEEWFWTLWRALRDTGKHYQCILCCDSDSYLRRPDGERLYHRGSPLIQT